MFHTREAGIGIGIGNEVLEDVAIVETGAVVSFPLDLRPIQS
jgi:hypothetical protein